MWIIISIISIAIAVSGLFWLWNIQPELVTVDEELAVDFPEHGFTHQGFEQLLMRFVSKDGRVNYPQWFEDRPSLKKFDQYLAALAKFSPENSPQRFTDKNDRLVYWVYAYNALVIKSILINWPLSSVTDLKAPVEIVQGLGFFYKQKFNLGGKTFSLHQIEKNKIFNGETDPRIHFILNCGSEGCPVMRPQLPGGDNLEPFLTKAASEFTASSKNLRIDHLEKIIYLSTIFDWYRDDFLRTRKADIDDNAMVEYLKSISNQLIIAELEKAGDYKLHYVDYDWSINSSEELQ